MYRQSRVFYFVVAMVLAAIGMTAQASQWWSVGAFTVAANAERESNRLNADMGLDTLIARSGDLYRVVLKKESEPVQQKAALKALGLQPWTLDASKVENGMSAAEVEKPAPQEPLVVLDSAQPSPTQASGAIQEIPVNKMSPPKAGEKLLDYCLRSATKQERAIYCGNDVFNRVASAQASASDQTEADHLLYCALLADGAERQARCSGN